MLESPVKGGSLPSLVASSVATMCILADYRLHGLVWPIGLQPCVSYCGGSLDWTSASRWRQKSEVHVAEESGERRICGQESMLRKWDKESRVMRAARNPVEVWRRSFE